VTTRTLGSRFDQAFRAQHLQMTADGRLRELEDCAQLVHGELIALESEQQPASRRVGEGGHLTEKSYARQIVNPFIRI
jgi:hypothetical protein